jgi:HK97 family phage prohead protease
MLAAAAAGALECRAEDDGTVRLSGRFPLGVEAELARGRREVFAPGAFHVREDVYLLSQHRFAEPLASTGAGTLQVRQGEDALSFEATLSPDVAATSHAADAVRLIRSGLAVGLSPGFKVPAGGEVVERRNGDVVRTIVRAELHEVSVVTRPAFESAQVEARSWQASEATNCRRPAAWRWR